MGKITEGRRCVKSSLDHFQGPPVVPGCAFPLVLQILDLLTATSVRVIQAHIGGQRLQAREVEEGRSSGSRKLVC